MYRQEKEIEKIDFTQVKEDITQIVNDLNKGMGKIIEMNTRVAAFLSPIGYEIEGESDARAVIEISFTVKMHGPHTDEEDYKRVQQFVNLKAIVNS